MDFFFLTSRQRKRKRAFFHESLLEGATHFMKEENDQNDPTNEVSAELDTNPLVYAFLQKLDLKVGTNEVPSPDQALNHFSNDLSYLSIPF